VWREKRPQKTGLFCWFTEEEVKAALAAGWPFLLHLFWGQQQQTFSLVAFDNKDAVVLLLPK
jgi:hypothetical protein